MNGCGGETIAVEAHASSDEGYEHLVTDAMKRAAEFLPGCAIHRAEGDCHVEAETEQWYIGCAHSAVSGGGQAIKGQFTFVRFGSEW